MTTAAIAAGLRALAANPLRTLLATLGVIVGTAALVAVLAVGDGVEAYARDQIAATTDLQSAAIVPSTDRNADGIRLPRTDTLVFTPASADSLARRLPVGTGVAAMRRGAARLTARDSSLPEGTSVYALMPGRSPVGQPDSLLAGRWLGDGADTEALVSPALAARLGAAALGATLELEGVAFTVVGVVAMADSAAIATWVPFARFEAATLVHQPATLLLRGPSIDVMPSIADSARAWVASLGDGGADGPRAEVQVRANRIEQVRQSMLVFKLLMGSITGISLLVGGIGIMNVLLASVFERTREIGVRRATGARRRDIVTQFLAEAVAVTGMGSTVGLVLGFAGAFGVSAIIRTRSEAPVYASFTLSTLLVAAGSAITIGLMFGAYPALKASRMSPIEAIRTES
ncbi:MAG TPA: ABC transporter permease [Gemmatimonadales bacterium]|nr:ABC transporter permease [Gemmatimonadales bacterium]